jgi:hypothetical protein
MPLTFATAPLGAVALSRRPTIATMTLQYLIFDASDDGEGTGTWEAMASTPTGTGPR